MIESTGQLLAISVSTRKGVRKTNVGQANIIADWGLEGDVHAGKWHRQVSILAIDSIATMRDLGADVGPGDFAENLTLGGIDIPHCSVGDRIRCGEVLLEVTQIGKECHHRCAIYRQVGDCVMPREGIFARVIEGGRLEVGMAVDYSRRLVESAA